MSSKISEENKPILIKNTQLRSTHDLGSISDYIKITYSQPKKRFLSVHFIIVPIITNVTKLTSR